MLVEAMGTYGVRSKEDTAEICDFNGKMCVCTYVQVRQVVNALASEILVGLVG